MHKHTSQEHIFYFAKTHFSYIHSKMLLIPNAKMQFSVQTRKTCQKKVDVQPVPLDQMTTPSGWQDFYFCASLLERYFKDFEDTFRSDSNSIWCSLKIELQNVLHVDVAIKSYAIST